METTQSELDKANAEAAMLREAVSSIQVQHDRLAKRNEGQHGMPQGKCQCEICTALSSTAGADLLAERDRLRALVTEKDTAIEAFIQKLVNTQGRLQKAEAERDQWKEDYNRRTIHHEACVTQRDTAWAELAEAVSVMLAICNSHKQEEASNESSRKSIRKSV